MPLHYVAWRDTMLRYGIVFAEQEFYSMAGMPSNKVIETLAKAQNVTVSDCQKIAEEKESEFLKNIDLLRPFDFTVEIVRKNHGRLPMAVASGGDYPVVSAQLTRIGIIHLFQTIVTAEHTEKHKPEPDVFLEAASRMQVAPEKCLVFEDGDLGIEAAKRAKMDYVDVRPHSPK